jgi:S1-C subfamily serine protease
VAAVDWISLVVVAFAALVGWRSGLLASALTAVGVGIGAVVGARLAPHLLPDGSRSPYTPLVALAGASVLAILLASAGSLAGATIRQGVRFAPLRTLDSAGGLVLGALAGLAIVWITVAVALHLPGQTELRQAAQRSAIARELNEIAPPRRLLDVLARVDPFPAIAGPVAPIAPPDPRLLRDPSVRGAAQSVVRVSGTACGLGIGGSGWVAARGLVVTAAHVVAGQDDTVVDAPGSRAVRAVAVAFDRRNDLAVLRADGLTAPPLRLGEPDPGEPVAILGYPEDGPLSATAGRIGRTVAVLSEDAYGRGPVRRTVTALRGDIRHGHSGGPAVDRAGTVATTVFAAARAGDRGFGVPDDPVRAALRGARAPVSTGPCVVG